MSELHSNPDPITKDEVEAIVEADAELEWSEADWVDMVDPGKRKPTRYFMILWQDEPCFWWQRSQVICSGPTEEQVGKLVDIAAKLKAKVVGEEGEVYSPDNWQTKYRGE